MPKRPQRQRGYTLVEALVALAIAGLLTAGVTAALRTGLDAGERIRDRADAHAEARAAVDVLAADLSAAFLSGANTEVTLFTAEPPELTPPGEPFLSLTTLSYRRSRGPEVEARAARSDAVRVDYALHPAADGGELSTVVRRERWLTETGEGEGEVVCERVAAVRLRYLDGGELQEGWSAGPAEDPPLTATPEEGAGPASPERRLPQAVEVVLLLAPPGQEGRAKPRVYRTLVQVRADGVPPFETEIVPPPDPVGGQPGGEEGGSGVERPGQ